MTSKDARPGAVPPPAQPLGRGHGGRRQRGRLRRRRRAVTWPATWICSPRATSTSARTSCACNCPSWRRRFEDLDDLIDEYIATQPLAAFAAGPPDAAAFLRWVSATYELTPEQNDHVACRQARYDVEDAARADRNGAHPLPGAAERGAAAGEAV